MLELDDDAWDRPWGRWAAYAAGVLSPIVIFIGGFVVFPWMFWLLCTFAFAVGAFGLVVYIYLIAPSLPLSGSALGTMYWITGALTLGPYVLDYRATGEYEVHPVERTDDGRLVFEREGDLVELEDGLSRWARLGLRPFGIVYEKSAQTFGDLHAEIESDRTQAIADGGELYILDSKRGGFGEWAKTEWVEGGPDGGWLVKAWHLVHMLRGINGVDNVRPAEQEAQKKHGGDTSRGGTAHTAMVLAALILGVMLGYVTVMM